MLSSPFFQLDFSKNLSNQHFIISGNNLYNHGKITVVCLFVMSCENNTRSIKLSEWIVAGLIYLLY